MLSNWLPESNRMSVLWSTYRLVWHFSGQSVLSAFFKTHFCSAIPPLDCLLLNPHSLIWGLCHPPQMGGPSCSLPAAVLLLSRASLESTWTLAHHSFLSFLCKQKFWKTLSKICPSIFNNQALTLSIILETKLPLLIYSILASYILKTPPRFSQLSCTRESLSKVVAVWEALTLKKRVLTGSKKEKKKLRNENLMLGDRAWVHLYVSVDLCMYAWI